MIHDKQREKELQELCVQVLSANPDRYYNPNGADETTCPFCHAKDYSSGSYNYGSGKTIQTGPKGGQYYYNSNGNKTYVPKR